MSHVFVAIVNCATAAVFSKEIDAILFCSEESKKGHTTYYRRHEVDERQKQTRVCISFNVNCSYDDEFIKQLNLTLKDTALRFAKEYRYWNEKSELQNWTQTAVEV